ncbi:hypothetical protein [Rubritalea tangerina]|uniref:RcnB family protein n=1 Tax=Rubritalea tangerina TaxID=430798 RepID=A0ABW4ZF19_9BACT
MMKRQWIVAATSIVWVMAAQEMQADKGGKGGGKGGKAKVEKKATPTGKVDKKPKVDHKKSIDKDIGKKHVKHDDWKFGDKDKNDLRDFYKKYDGKNGGLPPGLAKKVANGKPLPPGWRDKVKPGWVLDDDWWGRLNPLSSADLPAGFKLADDVGAYLLGDQILRVDKKTRKMIDAVDIPTIKID